MTTPSPSPTLPGRRGPQLILLLVALLVVALVWLQRGHSDRNLLEQMARRSLPLNEALANGRPTLVEFYADWCESCLAMAPAIDAMHEQHPQIDLVLLNVDNPGWAAELQRWGVNGIPHLQLFNAAGDSLGQAIGLRQPEELEALALAMESDQPLPQLAGVASVSSLEAIEPSRRDVSSSVGPRSHG